MSVFVVLLINSDYVGGNIETFMETFIMRRAKYCRVNNFVMFVLMVEYAEILWQPPINITK